jgi:integrase
MLPANKRKLTELYLQKLRPQSCAYMVWDTHQRGLALRVEPTGYRAWKVVYRHHGRARWYHLGAADAIGLADARKLAAAVMLEVIMGKDPAAERKAQRGAGTFADLASRYVEEHAKKKNKSWEQADYVVRRNLLPKWGKLEATTITRADVRAMMSRTPHATLANQVLAAASAIFSWAITQELISTNPCRGVPRNKTKSRERVLQHAELPAVWTALAGYGMQGMALKVLLLTGQRPGEVAHMRREHIADGWWTLPGAPDPALGWPGTKNGQTHRVWLPQAVQAIVAELGSDGFIFTNTRGAAITGLDIAMRRVCQCCDITEKITPHDLRRTHGTMITALGFGREALNRVQNHREGGIADVYDRHEYAAENKRVMEAVAARLLALATGTAAEVSNVLPVQFNRR